MSSDRTKQKLDNRAQREAEKRDELTSGEDRMADEQSDEDEVSDPSGSNLLGVALKKKEGKAKGTGSKQAEKNPEKVATSSSKFGDGSRNGLEVKPDSFGHRTETTWSAAGGKPSSTGKEKESGVKTRGAVGSGSKNEDEDEESSLDESELSPGEVRYFDKVVHRFAARLLKEDEWLLEMVRDEERVLCYEIHFLVPHCGDKDYRPVDSRHRFETVGDLFRDPSATDLVLNVNVAVSYDPRPADVVNQPPYRFNNSGDKKSIPAEDLVMNGHDWKPETDRNKYSKTRLGNIVDSDSDSDSDNSTTKKSASKTASGSKKRRTKTAGVGSAAKKEPVPTPKTLIGEWFTGHLSKGDDLSLMDIKAWHFEDFCIGNVDIGKGRESLASDDEYFQPYTGVKTKAAVVKRLSKRLQDGAEEPGSGVPFMPSYTLNDLDSEALGLGVKLKGAVIDGVVRFVDHIHHRNERQDQPTEHLSPPWLPFDAQFEFEQKDKVHGVMEAIVGKLRSHPKERGISKANKKTIQAFLKRKDWKLQLWVLPQKGRKMFRFPNGHAKGWGQLAEYLEEEQVKKGGKFARALYMEAQIVPRGGREGEVVEVSDEDEEEEENSDESEFAGKGKKGKAGKGATKGRGESEGGGDKAVKGGKKKAGARK